QNYIDPDICIECEQCVIVCPVEANFLDTDLPEKWHDYIDVNAAFFRQNKAAPETIGLETAFRIVNAVHDYASQNGLAVSAAIIAPAGGVAVSGAIGVAGGRNAEQDGLCCRVGMAVLESQHH